jgi:hypothetical protein
MKVPRTKVTNDFIQKAITGEDFEVPSPNSKVYWLGGQVDINYFSKTKKGQTFQMASLICFNKTKNWLVHLKQEEGKWLFEQIHLLAVDTNDSITWSDLKISFEEHTKNDFILFWNSPTIKKIREQGLVVI